MNGNKKILDGHLPWSHHHDSCTMAFGNPLLYLWEKKTSKSLSLRELEPFQTFTIPLENLQFHWKYVSLWEGFSEHCGLSPLRGPSAGAISGVQPSSLCGELRSVGYFRTTVTESFLFGFSPTSHPRLANYKAFATVHLLLKLDINWLQTKPAN